MNRTRQATLLAVIALVAYGGLILYNGGLAFERYRDENQFFEAIELFSSNWPPSVELLRSYPEPMTPLAFILWGAADAVVDTGPAGPRAVNLLLSLGILLVVGGRRDAGIAGLLCAVGLLVFPYYLPLSIHLYTDIPATFFVVLGFWLHARGQPIASALGFAAAIATRQYMVAFPAALAAAELAWRVLPPRGSLGRWRDGLAAPVVAPAVAMLSLGGWILFFGGLAPEAGIARWPRHTSSIAAPNPGYGLYFLSCVGAYFVLVETVLFRRSDFLRSLRSRQSLVAAGGIGVAFVVFSPLADGVALGAMNRGLVQLLPPEHLGAASVWIRMLLYAVLAWLTCIRFARFDLPAWLLLANFLMMTVSFEGWEKYALPVIASLWLLRSIDPLDEPLDLWRRLRSD